jgi:ADP-ribose diphosphatase
MTQKLPEILDSKIVAESRLFKIEGIHLRFSNGEECHYERLMGRASGSVMVVPVLNNDTILLIREYGAGIEQYTLGFPKGAIEPGEDVLESANREIKEEVGYGSKDLKLLKKMCLSPGYMESSSNLVIAHDLYECREPGDEPEPIEVVPWKLDNLDELIVHPEFFEARSIAALFLLLRM